MASSFPDHFSEISAQYLKGRPQYPDALFKFLAQVTPGHELVWDCATGNGQAAIHLAQYFKMVMATDASAEQIANAIPVRNVEYKVALAEAAPLAGQSTDLVTVATAAHWFQLDNFYNEVKRVLRPNGVVAIWGYGKSSAGKDVDEVFAPFAFEKLYDYWPDEAKLNWEDEYRSLSFPFEEIEAPQFDIELEWSRDQFLNYIKSWSSVKTFKKRKGFDPVPEFEDKLKNVWRDGEVKVVRWPIHIRIGKVIDLA